MRISNLVYLIKQGVRYVWHNWRMSVASYCIIMVSLLMLGLSVLLGMNVNIIIQNIADRNEVLVYTSSGLDAKKLEAIEKDLRNSRYTQSLVFYSKAQAWEDYSKEYQEYSVLFDYLKENPMPDTFRVKINDLAYIKEAAAAFAKIDGVETVNAPHDFAQFLVGARTTLSAIGVAVLAALVVVCLVIVYNSARASVFARRQEINIMRYVGATNAFIRIPFLVEGMFIGAVAGLTSWILTRQSYAAVVSLFADDLTIWEVLGLSGILQFDTLSLKVLAFDCIAGALVGASGTLLSMGKHLKV